MTTFHPSIHRIHLGLAVAITIMLINRTPFSESWNADIIFGAWIADLTFLSILSLIYYLVNNKTSELKIINRVNKILHYLLVILMLTVVLASQILFMKTREILDFHIISFAFNNAKDMIGVLGSEATTDLWRIVFIGLTPSFLACLNISNQFILTMRNLMLIVPLISLPSWGTIGNYDYYGNREQSKLLIENKAKPLYQNEYSDISTKELGWRQSNISHWKRGILTGLSFGSRLGAIEYRKLATKAGFEKVYSAPTFVSHNSQRPNIVFLILESVRHSEVGAYNKTKSGIHSITPFIDQLANDGIIVEQAYTTIPHTSKALVGIYCGTFPQFNSSISESKPDNLPLNCLPKVLGEAGYKSAHFQTAPAGFEDRANFLKNVGFDHHVTQEDFAGEPWERYEYLGLDDRALIKPTIQWMKHQRKNNTPYFASLLTVITHHPYASPGNAVPISNTREANKSYKEAVRYTDQVVKELFEKMRTEGLLENTIFVITGDHGEAFGEHGQIAHSGVAFEEGIRVPLILYGPNIIKNKDKIQGLRQHIDIMPTIMETAGIKYSGKLPGINLLTNKQGHSEIITSCFYTDYCLNHYGSDGLKTIYFYGKRNLEIYDLKADPFESNNLMYESSEKFRNKRLLKSARLKNSYESVFK